MIKALERLTLRLKLFNDTHFFSFFSGGGCCFVLVLVLVWFGLVLPFLGFDHSLGSKHLLQIPPPQLSSAGHLHQRSLCGDGSSPCPCHPTAEPQTHVATEYLKWGEDHGGTELFNSILIKFK